MSHSTATDGNHEYQRSEMTTCVLSTSEYSVNTGAPQNMAVLQSLATLTD